jgi:starch synthase (maltosyl-transferring)
MHTRAKSRGTTTRRNVGVERRRVIIEGVTPAIDCGRFPVKCEAGEDVVVEADVFTDGHDLVSCRLRWRPEAARNWREVPMQPLGNDRWRASFRVERLGRYLYTVDGWVDHFKSWRRDLRKRVAAGQDVAIDLLIGADHLAAAAARARNQDRRALARGAAQLRADSSQTERIAIALDEELFAVACRYPDFEHATTYGKELVVVVDPVRARFSAWYEMFPRSAGAPGEHGSFRDVETRLPYISAMGFDVLYLPPIHPIGETKRKGANNAVEAMAGEPGSPWGIGSAEGGHKAIHPQLGTSEDLRRLVKRARAMGIEVALDIAFQASPDHPYARERPEWFRARPDGTIQYAENPPKKYQDIYPFDFETADWKALWTELESVFTHWIDHGIRTFRVDNPHTKPFPFWEWAINRLKVKHPDLVFLSEAFTRPRVMYRLAKLGFTQSYTYFAWRNHKRELEEYLEELTRTEVVDYFRPSFWPNTPDILTEYLQTGGRPAFVIRFVLAATLAASYGIYGPAFELLEHRPREPGSEEYLHSEKYQLRAWDLERPDSLRDIIARVNRIRRENPALQTNRTLRFHAIENENIIAFSKRYPVEPDAPVVDEDGRPIPAPPPGNALLITINLDPYHTQAGWVDSPLDLFGIDPRRPFQVHDLLGSAHYTWNGYWNYVELNPHVLPAHIFRVSQNLS